MTLGLEKALERIDSDTNPIFVSDPLSGDELDNLKRIVKAYDIRGLCPEELTPKLAYRLGVGFAIWLRGSGREDRGVVLGRDMRQSGVELSAAFAFGLLSHGIDVIDLGLIATDQLYFASGRFGCAGAVFTASHNPAEYNGIKICGPCAAPISFDAGLSEIRDIAAAQLPDSSFERGSLSSQDVLADYVTHTHSMIDVTKLRPLKVVVDTANGMGGQVVPAAFEGLGLDVEYLFVELDGTFPNHPADPIKPENQRDLCERVRELDADIGLAFDGDADRVFIVDDLAQPLSGSTTTAMVAKVLLEANPGSTVLYNLICSRSVPEVIAEAGGISKRTRVGHSFIKAKMAQTGAIFAGEHSGHYYFADNFRADSGLIASLIILEYLSLGSQPLSELRKPFDRYHASGEINLSLSQSPVSAVEVIEALSDIYRQDSDAETDRLDGLTVQYGNRWFNLRPSNTEPLLRLNVEADSAEVLADFVEQVKLEIQAVTGA